MMLSTLLQCCIVIVMQIKLTVFVVVEYIVNEVATVLHTLRAYVTCAFPWARFSKVPKTFWARKAIRKTATRLFCKAGLFICCKGNKKKNNCKVSCLETPSL